MLQQPIDYTFGATPTPSESLMGGFATGYGIGDALRINNERNALQTMQQERQVEYEAALKKALSPGATPQDKIRAMMLGAPEQGKMLQTAIGQMDSDRRREVAGQAGAIYSAASTGNKKVAKQLLQDLAEAAKNSGKMDMANMYNTLAATADVNLDYVAQTALPFMLFSEEGLEVYAEVNDRLKKLSDEANEAQFTIRELRSQKASGNITAKNLKLLSDAEKAEASAFKEQVESGLSSENISSTTGIPVEQIEAVKSKQEEFSPEEENKLLNSLRDQYRKDVGKEIDILDSYDRIKLTEETAQGDVALIFSFMRMLDPNSTVREGEFATAENTTGWPQRIRNLYNKALQGKLLDPEQRKGFIAQADVYAEDAIKKVNFARDSVKAEAERFGLNTGNLFFKEKRESKESGVESNEEQQIRDFEAEYGL